MHQLKEEHKKILARKGGNYGEVRRLMEKTKLRRRQWIRTEEPMVSETIQKFPCLASIRLVSSMQCYTEMHLLEFLRYGKSLKKSSHLKPT